ncbi:hypothetical protein CCH79_00012947, partial [Gambusia affinis]
SWEVSLCSGDSLLALRRLLVVEFQQVGNNLVLLLSELDDHKPRLHLRRVDALESPAWAAQVVGGVRSGPEWIWAACRGDAGRHDGGRSVELGAIKNLIGKVKTISRLYAATLLFKRWAKVFAALVARIFCDSWQTGRWVRKTCGKGRRDRESNPRRGLEPPSMGRANPLRHHSTPPIWSSATSGDDRRGVTRVLRYNSTCVELQQNRNTNRQPQSEELLQWQQVRDDNRSSPPPITSLRWLEDEGDLKMKDSIYQICTATVGHTSLDLLEFARFGTGSGFVKMLCSQMKVLVVALCSAMLALHVSSAPQMDELTETLQAELISDKDLTGLLLLRFMSELMASRGEEMLREQEEEEEEEDELGGRQRLRRRHVRFTHRERKAGCRNFFWKTFTSCWLGAVQSTINTVAAK